MASSILLYYLKTMLLVKYFQLRDWQRSSKHFLWQITHTSYILVHKTDCSTKEVDYSYPYLTKGYYHLLLPETEISNLRRTIQQMCTGGTLLGKNPPSMPSRSNTSALQKESRLEIVSDLYALHSAISWHDHWMGPFFTRSSRLKSVKRLSLRRHPLKEALMLLRGTSRWLTIVSCFRFLDPNRRRSPW